MIKANRVRWAIKFINSEENNYWKLIGDKSLEGIGGLRFFKNFDLKKFLGINDKIPLFYVDIFKAWSEVCPTEVIAVEDVLGQPIFLNRKIVLSINSNILKSLLDRKITCLGQVWLSNIPNWKKAKEIGWMEKEYLIWRAILVAIPKKWKEKLRNDYRLDISYNSKPLLICIENESCPLTEAKTKTIYEMFIRSKACRPTSQKDIENKLKPCVVDWTKVYNLIYSSMIDTKLRNFEYKIKNNVLYLNQKLFTFGKIDSPLCSFCKTNPETMLHLFVECSVSKGFFTECQTG